MKLRPVLLLCLLLSLTSSAAQAQDSPSFAGAPPLPAQVAVGEHVTIPGKNLTLGNPVSVSFRTATDKDAVKTLSGVIAADPNKTDARFIDVRIEDVSPGRYFVSITIGDMSYPVPGELRVISARNPQLAELEPNIVYPTVLRGLFSFTLSGQNLGVAREDISLEVQGEGPIDLDVEGTCADNEKAQRACIEPSENLPGRVLTVRNFQRQQGVDRLVVKVADGPASNAIPVTFSRVPRPYVRWITLMIVGVLTLIVLSVLLWGKHLAFSAGRHLIADALLLDLQSNTFSLSKFQLLLWTGAAVFSYTYLFLCRSLVQWSLELPPIPEGLPNLMALSVGTTVVSSGITGVRGSKGAGPEHPSFADLFTSGGMVVGERFQFFLWTLIAVAGFIGIVLMNDPATLVTLPKIPENFLPLMGISALGYLGGKVVRKPGPIIKTLAITEVNDTAHTMTMTLQGENLSVNATVQIDDQLLRANLVTITAIKRDDTDSNLCSEVSLLIQEADAFSIGAHNLKIINPDGQSAVTGFPLDAMVITPPAGGFKVGTGVVEVQLDVAGSNFDDQVTATWQPPATNAATPATVAFVNKTSLQVKFFPGAGGGKGQLLLISAARLKAKAEILVT